MIITESTLEVERVKKIRERGGLGCLTKAKEKMSEYFLDAPSHLYMRSCPSVRPSVRRSVGPYVPCYFRTSKNDISEAPMTTKFNKE